MADGKEDWVAMMRAWYGPFKESLSAAGEQMEKVVIEAKPAGIDCPTCGKPMVIKSSRFGEFTACSGYPECKTVVRPQAEKVDVPCPKDGGEIVQKRTKKGGTFFGCANYPACDWTAWGKPVGRDCPKCGTLLIENTYFGRKLGIKCANPDCDHKEPLPRKPKAGEGDEGAFVPSDADVPAVEKELVAA